jgi:hypothetical protein
VAQGYHARQDNEWLRVAWLACHALDAFGKEPVSPASLLGKSFMAAMKRRKAAAPLVPAETDEE